MDLILIHLYRVDYSTLTFCTGPFPIKGMSGLFLLLSLRVLRRLIWIYTVWICSF